MSVHSEQLLSAAGQAHVAGRLQEAEELARQVLSADPSGVQARLLLGVLMGKTGRSEGAIPHFEAVLAAQPDSFEALFWLSTLHRKTGNSAEALRYARDASELHPLNPFGLNNLGLCLMDQRSLDEAVLCFEQAVATKPDSGQALHNLGTALYLLGRSVDAIKAFDSAIRYQPNSLDSYLSLGQAMIDLTEPAQAERCARKALELSPASVEARLLLASALAEQNLPHESEEHLLRAAELDPRSGKAQGLLGQRYQISGRFQEANAHLLKSIELEPRQGFAYFAYVHNNKVSDRDRDLVERMEQLAQEGRIDPREQALLEYGLGRSFESLGESEKALRHFDEANRITRKIKFGNERFDRVAYVAHFDQWISTFDRTEIERSKAHGNPSELPIVIVGMMRSGTTLAEQILSSHPEIGPAGEQRFWLVNSRRILEDPSGLAGLANEYLQVLGRVAPGSARVTDKNPGNYELLGPIHCVLPNARLIHMRRNPIDTCLSIYVTPNRVRVPFAYDRENIVFAYRQYLRLMDHWRTVVPADRLLEVDYEDLVADQEKETRRMLAFLGLEWDEAVLHPERNERTVLTPSNWQVRQPIYTGSVERWRRYEPWLGAFNELRNLKTAEN